MQRREVLTGIAGLGLSTLPGVRRGHAAEQAAIPTIAGPDPNTKTLTFKVPAGSVDTHTHIFGPAATYPFSPKRPYTPPDAPLELFRKLHDAIGVERAVIVNATVHGFDNRVVTDAIAQSGGRYKGVANINNAITDDELAALGKAASAPAASPFSSASAASAT